MSKGWDRACFDYRVRPDKIVLDVRRQDLMVPTIVDGNRVRLALLSLATGVMISLLFVWTVMMELAILGADPGRWFYPIVGGAALVFAVAIYAFATWDFERQIRWARD